MQHWSQALAEKKRTKRSDGVLKVAATDNNYTDRCLRRPDDDFWLWDDYVEHFGDPTEPKNRKKSHTKCVMEGVKGVVVPGGQKGPWKVEYRAGGRQNLEKTLDCGSSGGEEEVAEQQFSQASNLANEAYSRICTGAVAAESEFRITHLQNMQSFRGGCGLAVMSVVRALAKITVGIGFDAPSR